MLKTIWPYVRDGLALWALLAVVAALLLGVAAPLVGQ